MSGAGDKLSGAGDKLSGAGDKLSEAGDKLSGAGEKLCGAGEKLCGAGEKLSGADEKLSGAGDKSFGAGNKLSGMHYRRSKTEGASCFFTVNLADRRLSTLVDHIDLLRASVRTVKERHPFIIEAVAIMPEHLHTIWTLPVGDNDFHGRWALIKAGFSRAWPKGETISESRLDKGERGIWQRRYWEHLIRDDEDFARHVDYIHFNPVKHGHAVSPVDWEYSSIHRFVEGGLLSADWGASLTEIPGEYGE